MDKDFLSVVFAYAFATALIVIPVTIGGAGLREGDWFMLWFGWASTLRRPPPFLFDARGFFFVRACWRIGGIDFFIKNRGSGTAPNA